MTLTLPLTLPLTLTLTIGKYPREAVEMMSKLCTHSEQYGKANHVGVEVTPDVSDAPQGFAYAVAQASKNIDAACKNIYT